MRSVAHLSTLSSPTCSLHFETILFSAKHLTALIDVRSVSWSQLFISIFKRTIYIYDSFPSAALPQALCNEASLHALRRHYPQIYDSNDKLLVDPASVRVSRTDFLSAFKAITPSSHRSAVAHARSAGHMHHPCNSRCIPPPLACDAQHTYTNLCALTDLAWFRTLKRITCKER